MLVVLVLLILLASVGGAGFVRGLLQLAMGALLILIGSALL